MSLTVGRPWHRCPEELWLSLDPWPCPRPGAWDSGRDEMSSRLPSHPKHSRIPWRQQDPAGPGLELSPSLAVPQGCGYSECGMPGAGGAALALGMMCGRIKSLREHGRAVCPSTLPDPFFHVLCSLRWEYSFLMHSCDGNTAPTELELLS